MWCLTTSKITASQNQPSSLATVIVLKHRQNISFKYITEQMHNDSRCTPTLKWAAWHERNIEVQI